MKKALISVLLMSLLLPLFAENKTITTRSGYNLYWIKNDNICMSTFGSPVTEIYPISEMIARISTKSGSNDYGTYYIKVGDYVSFIKDFSPEKAIGKVIKVDYNYIIVKEDENITFE